jgi:hypothetical protein
LNTRSAWPFTLAGAIALSVCIDWSHEYWSVALPQILGFGLFMVWAVRFLLRRGECRVPTVFFPVAAMALWGAIQIMLALTVSSFTTGQSAVLWVSCAAYAWLGANVLAARPARDLFLTTILAFGTLLSVLAVIQFYTAPDMVFWLIPANKPIGPFIYKNHYAAFVELLFPVAVFRILADPRRAMLWGVVAATLFGGVVVSASRGGSALLLAEFLAILIIGAMRRIISLRRAAILSLQIPLLLASAVGVFGWQSIWEHFQESSSANVRKNLVISTAEMIATHPLTGSGLGTWAMVYPRFAHFDNTQFANEAHNDWLQWAEEGGIPFALLVMGIALWSFRRGAQFPWALGPAALFLHSSFDYPLRDPAVIALLFLVLGMIDKGELTTPKMRIHPRSQTNVSLN